MASDRIKGIAQYLAPKRALNRFAGFMANLRISFIKNYLIQDFVRRYQVNMTEAVEPNPLSYPSFNAFFIRKLKPEARPIATADIVSPIDGCISEIGQLHQGQLVQAKGHDYSVAALLGGDEALSSQFQQGSFATLYLSPKDYHRVHMPVAGQLQESIYIPGTLFSVQPSIVRVIPNLFARNERLVTIFSTEFGLMAAVLVGAAIVGSMGTAWGGDIDRASQIKRVSYDDASSIALAKADEIGYFKLGSTVVLLFANPLQWSSHWKSGEPIQLGQALGAFS
ncbi:MAG: archaetidylserine decarboxylase [Gammaproteobacteria bacterium]|nr:archaetidylserine decarboxylase [Gammaproteobacteria bacterium]